MSDSNDMTRIRERFTADELVDANERCRQYAGKPLDQCDTDDITRVRAGLATEKAFLTIMRDQALHDAEQVIERARQRAAREGA